MVDDGRWTMVEEQIEAILADSQVEGEFVLVSRQPSASAVPAAH
jgi:hypothetical protein